MEPRLGVLEGFDELSVGPFVGFEASLRLLRPQGSEDTLVRLEKPGCTWSIGEEDEQNDAPDGSQDTENDEEPLKLCLSVLRLLQSAGQYKVGTYPPGRKRPPCDEGATVGNKRATDSAEGIPQKPDAVARSVLGRFVPKAGDKSKAGTDCTLKGT